MSSEMVVRILVALEGADLPLWRRFTAPASCSLKDLHSLIQAAMGWQDNHLWEFEIGGLRFGDLDQEAEDDTLDAAGLVLAALITRGELTFSYVYDFGDDWRHTVTMEAVEAASTGVSQPAFLGGAGRCPPEDVGGTSGFVDFVKAVTTPWHREHLSMLEWYGGPFDPTDINPELIEFRFAQVASRRAYDPV